MIHKESVDKYGEILPEMKMSYEEVIELRNWLKIANEKRLIEIEEYKLNRSKNFTKNITIPK